MHNVEILDRVIHLNRATGGELGNRLADLIEKDREGMLRALYPEDELPAEPVVVAEPVVGRQPGPLGGPDIAPPSP